MFRIGEFSKLTRVSIRMLRYYDEMGLLKPAETDRFTNYRLYSADQIPVLNKIIFLRDLGFGVAEIAFALEHWSDDLLAKQLAEKRLEIGNAIKAEQEKLDRIEQAQKNIRAEKLSIHYNVAIKSVPGYPVFSLRRIVPDYYAEGQLWKEMSAFALKNNISISEETFTIYHDAEYREQDVDIEICAPVSQLGQDVGGFVFRNTEPVPIMAYTMVYGPFQNIASAYFSFADWLQGQDHYRMSGQSRQIVHRGPWNETDPEKYLTEIQIPLESK